MSDYLAILEPSPGLRVIDLRLPDHIDILEFDNLNEALLSAVEPQPDATPLDIVIDLTPTSYVGSAVLGLLVNCRSRVRRARGRLVLCGLGPRLAEIFRTGSLEQLFTITRTRADALRLLA